MSHWIMPPLPNLIETAIAPEFYIDGIGAIEVIDGMVRVYLCAEQMALERQGPAHKMVAVKLVGPISNVPLIIGQLATCLYRRDTEQSGPGGPRLVKG